MALKPLQDRIVIKVIEDTEQTSGGIFIPDSAKEKPQKGEVVAVGEGKTNDKGEKEPIEVKVGDMVEIIEGSLNSFVGTVKSVDEENQKLVCIVEMFGRDSEVELSFNQIRLANR